MMKSATRLATCTLGTAFLLGTVAAMAQDLPQYRDNRTGSVWTPQWVNEDAAVPSSSSASVNRAFNPNAQNVQVEGADVVDKISHLKTGSQDRPAEDVTVESVTVDRTET